MNDLKLLQLKDELSKSVVSFERNSDGSYAVFFNNSSGYHEFKDHLNHLYYEFIKEVQENLSQLHSEKESQIYLEMLLHLFDLLNEQIGKHPDFVRSYRSASTTSKINIKTTNIYTNSEDLNQLLIYFQYQKEIVKKCIKYIEVFKEKYTIRVNQKELSLSSWIEDMKEFFPEMSRIKNEVYQIESIPERINYLQKERDRLNLEYQKMNKQLYSSPINFFFESRIECLKDVLIWVSGKQTCQSKVITIDNQVVNDRSRKYSEGFKWTESKASLVELIYALYYNPKALDNGKNSIRELARMFEQLFDIDLGDVYHTYHELKSRKLEPAKFIDSLKSSFLRKIEEGNEQ